MSWESMSWDSMQGNAVGKGLRIQGTKTASSVLVLPVRVALKACAHLNLMCSSMLGDSDQCSIDSVNK